MKQALIFLVFLVACSQVTVTEEWPEGYPITEFPEPEKEVFEVPEPDPIITKLFTVVEGQPVTFILNDINHTMELFGVAENRTRMAVDGVSFMITENQSVVRSGVRLTLEEARKEAVPVPRRSVIDVSVGDIRSRLNAGQTVTTNNATLIVDFIGLQEETPHVRLVVGEQSAILSEKEEHYFDEFFVYAHSIDFNDATEFSYADAITVRVK